MSCQHGLMGKALLDKLVEMEELRGVKRKRIFRLMRDWGLTWGGPPEQRGTVTMQAPATLASEATADPGVKQRVIESEPR